MVKPLAMNRAKANDQSIMPMGVVGEMTPRKERLRVNRPHTFRQRLDKGRKLLSKSS